MRKFDEVGLSDHVIRATGNMGFEEMTPIQELAIPLALSGRDIIGQAQTGTGKTAAFGIPMAERISVDTDYVSGLVIAPTRELAIQVAEELNRICQFKGIRALPVYGGQDIERQIRALKTRPQIIVATPGRLMDHMRRRTIRLHQVETVVLDEADEMLSMGFIDDIASILGEVPKDRQTMLFSATISRPVQDLARRFMLNPEFISVKTKEVTVPNTEQYYLEVNEKDKFEVLCRLLDMQSPELAIIFGRTKRRVDELFEALNKRGYSAEGIHGDLTQSKRDSVMHRFKAGGTELLVATDVAARGLDISGVTHVYNFDIPQDPEGYVHRVGRTGRAGNPGIAITFVTPREFNHLRLIEHVTKRRMVRQAVPTIGDAREEQKRIVVEKLVQTVKEVDIARYKEAAQGLLEINDSVSLLSAAIKLLFKEPDTTPVHLTDDTVHRSKRPSTRQGPRSGGPGSKDRKPYPKKQYHKQWK